MSLKNIEIHNFRIYEHAVFDFDPRFNLVTGGNASGKTSLLEAIHFLATGKSFRSATVDAMLRRGAEQTFVTAKIDSGDNITHAGISATTSTKKISLNGTETVRMADLAKQIPLLVISPDSHFSFMQAPKQRRSVLDWLLFHVEPDFGQIWVRYQRALHQRNAALRDGKQEKSINAWGDELAPLGEFIHNSRVSVLSKVTNQYRKITDILIGNESVDIDLLPGWNTDVGLLAAYQADFFKDTTKGFTHSGPHRNDLRIFINGKDSQEQASHGQNKLLVIALRLAQISCFQAMTGRKCCLLVDDLPAELDALHREKLVRILGETNTQVFVTATDHDQVSAIERHQHAWFHVEHGNVKKLEKSYKSATKNSDKVISFPG